MNCEKCKTEISSEDIKTDFTDYGGGEMIDLRVECPECGFEHYTFIKTEDLTVTD